MITRFLFILSLLLSLGAPTAYAATDSSYSALLTDSKIPHFYPTYTKAGVLEFTVPSQKEAYLLVLPDLALSSHDLTKIDAFLAKGGHILSISNSSLTKHYKDLKGCASASHFPAPDGDLMQRFYCPRYKNSPSTLTLMNKNLFSSSDFDWADALRFPTPYLDKPPSPTLPAFSPFKIFFSQFSEPTDSHLWILSALGILLILLFLQARAYLHLLKSAYRSALFWIFTFSVVALVYDFFLFHQQIWIVAEVVLFLGVITFSTLRRGESTPLNFAQKTLFHALLLLIVLSPYLSFHFLPKEHDNVFSFSPAEALKSDEISLVSRNAWLLPEGSLLISGETLSLGFENNRSFKQATLQTVLKGYDATVHARVEPAISGGASSFPFFVSALTDFMVAKEFSPSFFLYRSPDTKIFKENLKDLGDLKKFLERYLPRNATISTQLQSESFKPEDFFVKYLPLGPAYPPLDVSTSFRLNSSHRFYTYVQNSFDLELSFNDAPYRFAFFLSDATGRVIDKKLFIPSEQAGQDQSTFSFGARNLKPGVYRFWFERLSLDADLPSDLAMIQHVRLNSPYLTFFAPTASSFGDAFSKASWFNPFRFSFHSAVHDSTDYAVIENYNPPIPEPGGWFNISRTLDFARRTKKLEAVFTFLTETPLDADTPQPWILLKKIDLTLN